MRTVDKVTVSLPHDLFEFVEQQRARSGSSRSETVATLIRRAQHEFDLQAREERYIAAYRRLSETAEEVAFAEAAAEEAFATCHWGNEPPDPGSRATR